MEFVSEKGELERRVVTKEQGTFGLRANLPKMAKFIEINRYKESVQKINLMTIDLGSEQKGKRDE